MRTILSTSIEITIATRLQTKLNNVGMNVSDYIAKLIKEDIEK